MSKFTFMKNILEEILYFLMVLVLGFFIGLMYVKQAKADDQQWRPVEDNELMDNLRANQALQIEQQKLRIMQQQQLEQQLQRQQQQQQQFMINQPSYKRYYE